MADTNPTIMQELAAAGRGVAALLIGDRGAARHFDFSERGLVSSFLAQVAVLAMVLALYVFAGAAAPGDITRLVVINVVLYATLLAATALVLRQVNRGDALRPYIVTFNWANVILGAVSVIFSIIGLGVLSLALAIAGLVLMINIARLIMTLKFGQIVALMLVQVVGALIGVVLLVLLFPPTPEELAAAIAAASV